MKRITYKLENGIKVIMVNDDKARTVKFRISVKAGSDYETKEQNGLSHFLEHMCFKGTKKRSSKNISFDLDAIGASYNASTSTDSTTYYAKAGAEKFDVIFDIVSDIYLNSILPEEELEKERGVIIEEINMYEDEPRSKVDDVFIKLAYGDQSAGRPIIGPKENIRNFTQKDFLDYRNARYVPSNTILVLSGKFNVALARKKIKEVFGKVKNKKSPKQIKTKESQNNPELSIFYKDTDQAHIIFGFRTTNIYSEDRWALQMASMILGGGMSSKLFTRMRDELGMCYYVGSMSASDAEKGMFVVYGGMNKNKASDAVNEMLLLVGKIKNGDFTDKEFEKARDLWIGRREMALETAHDLADLYENNIFYDKEIMTPEQIFKRIRKITKKDVVSVMNKYVKNQSLNLAIVGPFKNTNDFKKVIDKKI
jgi:predicted Zn-dependent peptidase